MHRVFFLINHGLEKRLVMVSVKRMIGGVIAAVFAVALNASPAAAAAPPTAEIRDKPRQGGTPNVQAVRNPRDAKRPYAKRGEVGEAPRPPRLSAEERRQLRRDVKDAGRQIYPPRR